MTLLRCCCCQAQPTPPPSSTDCFWSPPPLVPPSPESMTSYHAPTIQLEFPHVTARSIFCSLFGIVLLSLILWCCKKKKKNDDHDAGDPPAHPIDPDLVEDALCKWCSCSYIMMFFVCFHVLLFIFTGGAAGAVSCSGCG